MAGGRGGQGRPGPVPFAWRPRRSQLHQLSGGGDTHRAGVQVSRARSGLIARLVLRACGEEPQETPRCKSPRSVWSSPYSRPLGGPTPKGTTHATASKSPVSDEFHAEV